MAIMVTSNGERGERPPVGPVAGIIIGIYDLGWQSGGQFGPKEKVLYLYEVDHRLTKGTFAGKRHLVSHRFTKSLHEKSGLAKHITAIKGRALTEEESKGYDVEQDIGLPVFINLVLSPDGQYVNIGTVMPMPKGMPAITQETPKDYIPEWITKAIEEGKKHSPQEMSAEQASEGNDPAPAFADKIAALRTKFAEIKASGLIDPDTIHKKEMELSQHKGNYPSLDYVMKGLVEMYESAKSKSRGSAAEADKLADEVF